MTKEIRMATYTDPTNVLYHLLIDLEIDDETRTKTCEMMDMMDEDKLPESEKRFQLAARLLDICTQRRRTP